MLLVFINTLDWAVCVCVCVCVCGISELCGDYFTLSRA